MDLTSKVSDLNRVGKTAAKRLKNLGVETVQDLLFYFPFRYEDFSQTKLIAELADGEMVTIKGKIELIANRRSTRKRTIITEAVIVDTSGRLRVVWFGQPFIARNLKVGDIVFLSGKVKSDMFGAQMVSPSYERRSMHGDNTHTARIVPMYALTAGLTQKQIRFLIRQAVGLSKDIKEWVPKDLIKKANLMSISNAVRAIHFPDNSNELKLARRRLKFDELFILQLRAEMVRQSLKRSKALVIEFKEKETRKFVNSLPFKLTKAQKVAAWEILRDIGRAEPMNRLLEGDVGAGKTVVAAIALYNAVLNGYQSSIMAPTEILAKQHFESLKKMFGGRIKMILLTRSEMGDWNLKIEEKTKAKKKEKALELIKQAEADIVVGTHALLTEKVEFGDLALVIVDEQHRFGVSQRKRIKEKTHGETMPHFLSMTATPIPRSLALTLYGDLDLSIIDKMPPERKSVKTRVVNPHNREKAYRFIYRQIKQGRQVFVICPLISFGDDETANGQTQKLDGNDDKRTVMAEYEKLTKKIFPDLKIGYLHGKLKTKEKNKTMAEFLNGEMNILVSTSVIEVGIDVPNASVMMIEGAEHFGLAQLHQFRGRVGRSSHQSYCFLFTDSDSRKVAERLEFFERNASGFKLAEYDLDQRGPGEVYGAAQSGMMNFRLAAMSDVELIKRARKAARGIDFEKYPELREKVMEWEGGVHLE